MWWPFAKRGTRVDALFELDLPVQLPGDLSVFASNDACIKVWLPEKLMEALDRMSGATGQSRPDVLRWLLFEHVYGRPAFETLKSWKLQQDEIARRQREAAAAELPPVVARFSPMRSFPAERTVTAQLLGKSAEDFKLWLPAVLKREWQNLATLETLGLSDYLRKTLVRILFGETFHHRWRETVGKLPEEVRRFEQGI